MIIVDKIEKVYYVTSEIINHSAKNFLIFESSYGSCL